MTAIQARATHLPVSTIRLTFPRQLRSELIKLMTVRGTWWSVAIVAALSIGLAFLATMTMSPPSDVMMAVVAPVQFTMLLAGILGVISVTGEYSTGMIRSTLTANPVRGSVLVAKSIVLAVFMFVVSLVILLASAIAITPLAAANDMAVQWSDPALTLVPILSAAGAMALFALLGVGLGFLLRSGAAAIATTVGILFVLPIIVMALASLAPDVQWLMSVGDYLPSAAVQSAIMPAEGYGLTRGEAWVTLVAWPGITLLGAWAVLRGKDA
ncbi:ABC transporter permease subunit [Microbacterium sp. H1-D42]|uniref:ABC transporter permease subunit n=1 Tax=Microbacterium sp. H1-D42 TaxID=2925844 RepID=UPI001F52EC0A|nr:ABC transporter permease subunit [Microbacterium sp. H1-D42]UNK71033.1 ABC transporter permease [Microbacterium sp. H1-D42]